MARATPLEVAHAPVDLLHAERLDITERFELVRVEVGEALVGSTRLDGIEISEVMTPATTFVSRGHWTYSVTLRERDPDGVPEGVFDVQLAFQGAPMRAVRLVQNVSDPLLQEGARVTFDLGPAMPSSPLFVLSVREVAIGPIVTLASAIDTALMYVWRDGAQNENPTLHFHMGDDVTFVASNGDGTSPHNLQIPDGGEPMPATEDMINAGDEQSLAWTPPAPGSYHYECHYHPTMKGTIEVD